MFKTVEQNSHVIASPQGVAYCHCERSAAISFNRSQQIATSLTLLAMTTKSMAPRDDNMF
jgi:hypothetical protein